MPGRNYRKEYDNYHARPEQRRRRAARNRARRIMMKAKGRKALRGKDVDHKDRNPENNSARNLRISTRHKNRSRNQ